MNNPVKLTTEIAERVKEVFMVRTRSGADKQEAQGKTLSDLRLLLVWCAGDHDLLSLSRIVQSNNDFEIRLDGTYSNAIRC